MINRDTVLGSSALGALLDVTLNGAEILLTFGDLAFYPVSIAFGTMAPNMDWISQSAMEPIVVFVATLYITNQIIIRYQRYRNNDND